MNEIQCTLIEFIKTAAATHCELQTTTDLLTNNVMDSLMLMELVLLTENKWNIRLQGDDIAPSNFRTIECLANLISDRLDESNMKRHVA